MHHAYPAIWPRIDDARILWPPRPKVRAPKHTRSSNHHKADHGISHSSAIIAWPTISAAIGTLFDDCEELGSGATPESGHSFSSFCVYDY